MEQSELSSIGTYQAVRADGLYLDDTGICWADLTDFGG